MATPWLKFYTADWRADPRLRMCSMAARGLWIEMICLMHEAHPYGHLLVSGQCPTDAQLAVLVGAPPDQIAALLGELESAGVFSRTKEGAIYSRKLSRMAKKAATARNNGRKGGNPSLSKERRNSPSVNPPDKDRDKPQIPEARVQKEKREPKGSPKKKTRFPSDWRLPSDWRSWALEQGMDEVSVRREALQFADHHVAKGSTMVDWKRAWQTWVRNALKWDRPARQKPQIGDTRTTKDGRKQEYVNDEVMWLDVHA